MFYNSQKVEEQQGFSMLTWKCPINLWLQIPTNALPLLLPARLYSCQMREPGYWEKQRNDICTEVKAFSWNAEKYTHQYNWPFIHRLCCSYFILTTLSNWSSQMPHLTILGSCPGGNKLSLWEEQAQRLQRLQESTGSKAVAHNKATILG